MAYNQLSENHLTPTGTEPQAHAIVQGKLFSLVLSEKKARVENVL